MSAISIHKDIFGRLEDGRDVSRFIIKGEKLEVHILDLACTISALYYPDRNGHKENLVLAYDTLKAYENDQSYFGALVGRVANRVSGAAFEVHDKGYILDANEGRHHLHGGRHGLSSQLFASRSYENTDSAGIRFNYLSPHLESGYPGRLDIEIKIELGSDDTITMEYTVQTDKACPVNLTHHDYFNLSGDGKTSVNQHLIKISSDSLTLVDHDKIPTGEILALGKSGIDPGRFDSVAELIEKIGKQCPGANGVDLNFILSEDRVSTEAAAVVQDVASGRQLEVFTNQPCIQVYTSDHLDEDKLVPIPEKKAICLETQAYPNAVNQHNFPSVVLNPGEKYYHICQYKFSNI